MAKLPKIHLPFFTGLDTGKDPLTTPSRTMAELRNVRFDKAGAIVKRPGYLPVGAELSGDAVVLGLGPTALTADAKSVLVGDSDTPVTGDIALTSVRQVAKIVDTTPANEAGLLTSDATQRVDATLSGVADVDVAVVGDFALVVWRQRVETVGGTKYYQSARWQIFNYKTGTPVVTPQTMVAGGQSVGVSAHRLGDYFLVVSKFTSGSANSVKLVVLSTDGDTITQATPVTTVYDGAGGVTDEWPNWAVVTGRYAGAWKAWIVAQNDTLPGNVLVTRWSVDSGTEATSGPLSLGTGTINNLSAAYSETDQTIGVVADLSSTWKFTTINPSTLAVANSAASGIATDYAYSAGVQRAGIVPKDGGGWTALLPVTNTSASGPSSLIQISYNSTLSSGSTATFLRVDADDDNLYREVVPISRPWVDSLGKLWVVCSDTVWTNASPLGVEYPIGVLTQEDRIPAAVLYPGTLHRGENFLMHQTSLVEIDTDVVLYAAVENYGESLGQAVNLLEIRANGQADISVSGSNASGGLLLNVANGKVTEGSIIHPGPEMSIAGSGTGLTGTFSMKAMPRMRTASGDIVLGAESAPDTVTITDDSIVFTYYPGGWSYDLTQLVNILYMTDSSTGIYHQIDAMPTLDGPAQIVQNTAADTTKSQPFYAPGEIQGSNVGFLRHVALSSYRLWATNGEKVFYSRLIEPGIQPLLSQGLFISPSSFGGEVMAIGFVGDTTIILKEQAVYAVAGDGPDNLGRGGFSEPRLVHPSVGCANPKSVVQTPRGLIWQSDKGFYALTNNFQVSYVGEPVEDYNNVQVTAAWCVPGTNEVRWLTSDGIQLVFDYEHGVWATDDVGGSCAVVDRGTYYRGSGRKVLAEVNGEYHDDGTFYPMVAEYNWVKLDRLASEVSWRNLEFQGFAEQSGDITVRVTVWYDFDEENVGDTWDITWADCVPGKSLTFTKRLRKPKSRAVKIRFEELNPNGAGLSFSSCALQFKQYGGRGRFPASRKPRST